jgi:hypothetical protein
MVVLVRIFNVVLLLLYVIIRVQLADFKCESHEMLMFESDESNGAQIPFRNSPNSGERFSFQQQRFEMVDTFTMGI